MPAAPPDVKAIFLAAAEKATPAERAAYLDDACARNPAARQRVEALLRAHDEPSGTGAYAPGPEASTPPAGVPGERVGPYKLLQQIGEGGMGAVWLAEQEQPVRRRVALKVIKAGMDSAQVIARFEAERQALALMDHPNIAKVLDAGTTDTGRPYFVMELVKGTPITKFCDQQHLTPRERLELFIPVCQAVQHAHQKGVIHRDLKPSNVLIGLYDGRPVPKVIDFGVAKATNQKLTERTMFTGVGVIVGTLEYMAPEQAELDNLDIDTRSDIYSLGVLLYELLTGSPPFTAKQLRTAGLAEMLRLIREVEPPKPSTKLSSSEELPSIAASRKLEPAKLARLMRGELDWVVMKCLEKDRARRYETANGLALDVQRYLADEPVVAGPPGAGYRLRKFARKYRRLLAVVMVIVVLLVSGIVGTSIGLAQAVAARKAEATQRQRAESEAAIAKAVNEFLQKDMLEQAHPTEGIAAGRASVQDIRLRTVLDRAAERIGGKFEKQPLVEAAVRLSIGGTYLTLRETEAARPHLERAWDIRRRELGEEHLETMDALGLLGTLQMNTHKSVQAEASFTRVLEIRRRILGDDHPDTLYALHCLGLSMAGRDDTRAEPLLARCLEGRRRSLGEEHDDTRATAWFLALVYSRQGRHDLSESLRVRNLEIRRRMHGEDHLATATEMWSLGQHYLGQGKYAQAEPLFLKCLETRRRIHGPDHRDTLLALRDLGRLYLAWRKPAQAEPLLIEAWNRIQPRQDEERWGMVDVLSYLAQVDHDLGKYAQAEQKFAQAVANLRRWPDWKSIPNANVLERQGVNLLQQQKYAAAERSLGECLAIIEKRSPDHWSRFNVQSWLGSSLLGQQKYAEAESLLLQGYEGLKQREGKIPAGSKARLTEALERLVQLYEATAKPDDAAKWRKELEAVKATKQGAGRP